MEEAGKERKRNGSEQVTENLKETRVTDNLVQLSS